MKGKEALKIAQRANLKAEMNREMLRFLESISPKKTNGDRIRAMSDEELADFILDTEENPNNFCTECVNYNNTAPHCRANDIEFGCKDAAIKWLQQPAEGGE